jgi:hypothetical protein
MATAVQKITLSSSRDIPFNKLVLSQSNVRRVKAGVSIEELAEDIARRTLLQGLNVRPVLDADGVETGMFEVPAGGRRYRALQLLVKQKRLAKTAPVPSDRCGRAHHRTQGLARLGRNRPGDGHTGAHLRERLRRPDGRPHYPRSRGGPAASPRSRHGREPHRAVRFHRYDAGLKVYGLFHEIISWKLRMFVPTDENGVEVLAKVLDRYAIERVGEREAA